MFASYLDTAASMLNIEVKWPAALGSDSLAGLHRFLLEWRARVWGSSLAELKYLYRERIRVNEEQLKQILLQPFDGVSSIFSWCWPPTATAVCPDGVFELTSYTVAGDWLSCPCTRGVRIYTAALRARIRALKRSLRLLNFAIRATLKAMARRHFPHRLIRNERSWSLLHGSHPPREDAEIVDLRPGMYGRVFSTHRD